MWYVDLFIYAEFDVDIYDFCCEPEIPFLEKLVQNYESSYKCWFNLLNFIMSNVCFEKLVKISENISALQNSLFRTTTE